MSSRGRSAKSVRQYRADDLATSACFCPACRHRLEVNDVHRCPACGFTGGDTMRFFSFEAPPAERLGDHASLFTGPDRKRVERELSRFTERFPQFDLRIVTVDLDPSFDFRLFVFWLLNAMPLAKGETAERREWCLLLVIRSDLLMALAPGYAAEVWTGEVDWPRLLEELAEEARTGSLAAGLKRFCGQLTERLVDSWQRMEDRRTSGRLRRSRIS